VKIVKQYERAVVWRFGKVYSVSRGPGLFFFLPVDEIKIFDIRVQTIDFPPQAIITKDGISANVNAIVFYYIADAVKAATLVEDVFQFTKNNASTTVRGTCGEFELDALNSKQHLVAENVERTMDALSSPMGIKCISVEMKDLQLPMDQQRSMSAQAESERDRRAQIISAEGERQAASMLKQASQIMTENPSTIQLRFLDTLREVSSEKNETVVFPLPSELIFDATQGTNVDAYSKLLQAIIIAEGLGKNDFRVYPPQGYNTRFTQFQPLGTRMDSGRLGLRLDSGMLGQRI
jgi:regulator of protease activity HflC (stomatin/prohibitin superfamily)